MSIHLGLSPGRDDGSERRGGTRCDPGRVCAASEHPTAPRTLGRRLRLGAPLPDHSWAPGAGPGAWASLSTKLGGGRVLGAARALLGGVSGCVNSYKDSPPSPPPPQSVGVGQGWTAGARWVPGTCTPYLVLPAPPCTSQNRHDGTIAAAPRGGQAALSADRTGDQGRQEEGRSHTSDTELPPPQARAAAWQPSVAGGEHSQRQSAPRPPPQPFKGDEGKALALKAVGLGNGRACLLLGL